MVLGWSSSNFTTSTFPPKQAAINPVTPELSLAST
eukprot:03209.XXX_78498_78602_1 [CDS] Oithona nana genome sequencing.